jgi:hypothetical protein
MLSAEQQTSCRYWFHFLILSPAHLPPGQMRRFVDLAGGLLDLAADLLQFLIVTVMIEALRRRCQPLAIQVPWLRPCSRTTPTARSQLAVVAVIYLL